MQGAGSDEVAHRLTVSRQYPESRASRSRYLPIAPMPFLRLRGRWLDEADFAIGANVRVEVTAGRLVSMTNFLDGHLAIGDQVS